MITVGALLRSRSSMVLFLVVSRLTTIVLVALSLGGCVHTHRHRDFRFMQCLGLDACPTPGRQPSPWTAEHEALYWNTVLSLARETACGGEASIDRIAFQSERRLALSCDKTKAKIPWLDKNDRIEDAFARKDVDRVAVFEKEHGLRTSKGIGVRLMVSYYLKSDKAPGETIAEGMLYYDAVEVGDTVEVQWNLKVSF